MVLIAARLLLPSTVFTQGGGRGGGGREGGRGGASDLKGLERQEQMLQKAKGSRVVGGGGRGGGGQVAKIHTTTFREENPQKNVQTPTVATDRPVECSASVILKGLATVRHTLKKKTENLPTVGILLILV